MNIVLASSSFANELSASAADASLLTARTTLGPLRGTQATGGSGIRWLGIPYAKPPIGDLRWKAPEPHQPWTDVRSADVFGSPCAQLGSIYGPPPDGKVWGASNVEAFDKPVGSEDCLTLNVWKPNHSASRLPVIVFVHGGSNIAGYSGDPVYEGEKLAAATGSVVVTVNYRLGIFGWMTHPAFQSDDAKSSSGNFGTLDILLALRFIQSNAAAFGGDPANVTLMGQSAGAINVYSVMGSPLGAGLFQKAIILSGIIVSTPREKGYEFSRKFATQLVMDDGLAKSKDAAKEYLENKNASELKAYLKSKTTAQLLTAQGQDPALRRVPTCFGDGAVIPADLNDVFEKGQFNRVPTIVGMTRDEAKLFTANVMKVSDAERFTLMLKTDSDAAPTLKLKDLVTPYLLPALGSGFYDAYAWLILKAAEHQANAAITTMARHEPKVFAYRFDWNQGPEPWRTLYGAGHAIDLAFVFGNFSNNFFSMDFSKRNSAGREALSKIMMRTIGAFVRSGDPNNPELTATWDAWSPSEGKTKKFVFNATDQEVDLSVR